MSEQENRPADASLPWGARDADPSGKPVTRTDIESGDVFRPLFDSSGLIGAVVREAASGDVLMFAWMNDTALAQTLATGEAHFWSRSRQRIWKKGEESGNVLVVREIATDCDQDVLLISVTVKGAGVVCHTGARTCFYRAVAAGDGDTADRCEPVGLVPRPAGA